MVLLFTAFQVAWPAFAYSIEDEDEAKRAYSYVLTYLMFVAAWAAVGLSLFAPWIVRLLGAQAGLLAGRGSAIPALAFASVFFAGFIVVTIATGRTRQTQFNWVADDGRRRPQLRAEPLADPGLRDARRGVRHPGRLHPHHGRCGRGTRSRSTRSSTSGGGWPSSSWRPAHLPRVGKTMPQSLPARVRPDGSPIRSLLAALGFYLPAERKRLRRLLPAHN